MTPEQKQRIAHEISNWNNARNDHSAQITGDRMAALLQELVDAPEPEPVARVTGYYAGYLSIATVDGRVLPAGTALYAAPPHQSEHHLEMVNTPAPSVPDAELVTVPRELLGAASYAIKKNLPAPKILEQLRRYALGGVAAPTPAPSVPDWQGWAMRLIDFIEGAEVSSGMCCCGEDMARHASPINCGHSPVDMWDNCVKNLRAEFDKFVAAAPTPAEAPADVARDAARLDWLDERNAPHGLGWEIIQMSAGNVHIHTLTGDKAKFESIRDAIDAAIERQGARDATQADR